MVNLRDIICIIDIYNILLGIVALVKVGRCVCVCVSKFELSGLGERG